MGCTRPTSRPATSSTGRRGRGAPGAASVSAPSSPSDRRPTPTRIPPRGSDFGSSLDAFDLDLADTGAPAVALARTSIRGSSRSTAISGRRHAAAGDDRPGPQLAGLGLADPAARRRLAPRSPLVDGALPRRGPGAAVLGQPPRAGPGHGIPARRSGRSTPPSPTSWSRILLPTCEAPAPPSPVPLAAGTRHGLPARAAGSAAPRLPSARWTWSAPVACDRREPVARADDARVVVGKALLEARLRFAVLVAGPIDALLDRAPAALGTSPTRAGPSSPRARAWDPAWARAIPLNWTHRSRARTGPGSGAPPSSGARTSPGNEPHPQPRQGRPRRFTSHRRRSTARSTRDSSSP